MATSVDTRLAPKGEEIVGGEVTGVARRMRWSPAGTRSLVGVALVVSSVAGVWWIVNQSSSVSDYLMTTKPALAGTALSAVEWEVVSLGTAGRELNLVRPDELAEVGAKVLTTDLPAGVVVSSAQLRDYTPTDYTTFTTSVALGGAPWLVPGARVEVWVSPSQPDQGFSVPQVIAPVAVITGVRADEGFAADSRVATIDVLVHRRELPALIHASANDFDIQVSPVTGVAGLAR